MVIQGRHTSLKSACDDDVDLLVAWFADPEVNRYWGGRPLSKQEVRDKYADKRKNVRSFIVEASSMPVGYLQYHQFEDDSDPKAAGLDLFVIPEVRGTGIAADAVQSLVQHLHRDLGLSRVTVDPALNNPRAVRFWEKCGFLRTRGISGSNGPALLMGMKF